MFTCLMNTNNLKKTKELKQQQDAQDKAFHVNDDNTDAVRPNVRIGLC